MWYFDSFVLLLLAKLPSPRPVTSFFKNVIILLKNLQFIHICIFGNVSLYILTIMQILLKISIKSEF